MFENDAVVLVPGLFGFGTFGEPPRRISYFERVGRYLGAVLAMPPERILVHAPKPTASFAVRVASLHDRVKSLLEEGTNGKRLQRIHLVGHSTGGVDVRLLLNAKFLWPGGPEGAARTDFLDRIGAAVSMSAPHHGSPIAVRLRSSAELVLPVVTMLSILGRSGRPADAVGLASATAAGFIRNRRGAIAMMKMLTSGLAVDAHASDDIRAYLSSVATDRTLLDELAPTAMDLLNERIAGGERRLPVDYVTVAPSPRVRLINSPIDLLGRTLYAAAHTLTTPARSAAQPFPRGPFLEPSSSTAQSLRSAGVSDGVVPSASQAFTGEAALIVEADHLDPVGHFDSSEWFGLPVFKSDANFSDERFEQLWRHVARSIAGQRRTATSAVKAAAPQCDDASADEYDYIVVGSGAGGGPVASNLARAGMRVLLLEAGPRTDGPLYEVPAFHGRASESAPISWNFFVRHYADNAQATRDSKYQKNEGGVLYPRAATVGGCTAHNAMITIAPHDSDWDGIAELTGDATWRSERMRSYFARLEACRYLDLPRGGTESPSKHGFDGWLSTYEADPKLLLADGSLLLYLSAAVRAALAADGGDPRHLLEHARDPNDVRIEGGPAEGIYLTPIATTRKGRRVGTRERIVETEWLLPAFLTVRSSALVTRVLLDDSRNAIGVEYVEGEALYRASPGAASARPPKPPRVARARREVILAGGAFNTPQLLKLSGIGPAAELQRHGIEVRVPLAGVGENLQDRYEVGVVSQMRKDFPLLRGLSFAPPVLGRPLERAYRDWLEGRGVYTTNGVVLSIIKKSRPELAEPDLFVFGIPGDFRGYYPGYSDRIAARKNIFTWAVLKGHTRNTAGRVTLRSADPRDVPDIHFAYFHEGNDRAAHDLAGVMEGVKFARKLNSACTVGVGEELVPGAKVASDDDLAQFVRDEAWGHHACGTARIGPASDPLAVVDSRFRVHGVGQLRIVDASIFPRIPGFFIAAAIYMAAEKASDVILDDAVRTSAPRGATPCTRRRVDSSDEAALSVAPAE